MRDWHELVRQRLARMTLEPGERSEVIEELTAHLEETYEGLLKTGVAEEEAVQRALGLAGDWQDLRRQIDLARTGKDTMTNRVRQLWLPGFLTFVTSTLLFELFEIFGPKPWIAVRSGNMPLLIFQWPWLLSLPLIGAMGAYLSWRGGGSKRAVLLSIVFPILPFLASILIWLPFGVIFYYSIGHNSAPMAGFMAIICFVLAPGVALLAGGLPARLYFSRRLTPRDTISH